MIMLSCFVFSIVLVMLGYCIWKYRAKPGDESDGEPIHGNTKLEIAWTVIPTVIVLFGAIYSWIVLGDIESKASDALHIDVTAQQYKWTFNYPQPNGKVVSSNDARRSRQPPAQLHLTALDVLHSFWVPEWRIKRDLVPAGAGRQRRRQHGRRDPGPARDLQRGLHGALRLRPRDDARPGPGGAARRSSRAGSQQAAQVSAARSPTGTATGTSARPRAPPSTATGSAPTGLAP